MTFHAETVCMKRLFSGTYQKMFQNVVCCCFFCLFVVFFFVVIVVVVFCFCFLLLFFFIDSATGMKAIIISVSLRELPCIPDKLLVSSQSDDRNPHTTCCTSILGTDSPVSRIISLRRKFVKCIHSPWAEQHFLFINTGWIIRTWSQLNLCKKIIKISLNIRLRLVVTPLCLCYRFKDTIWIA